MWRGVWGIQGPPKLRHFIWRACNGSLGVRERLYHPHIIDNSDCQVCGGGTESITHALFDCSAANIIWAQSEFRGLLMAAPSSSFADRFEWVAGRIKKEELHSFCTNAWAAWFCRNKKKFQGNSFDPIQIAINFSKYVSDYMKYTKLVSMSSASVSVSPTGWSCPPRGCVKMNSDAHIGADGSVGLGVVFRDAVGVCWPPELRDYKRIGRWIMLRLLLFAMGFN